MDGYQEVVKHPRIVPQIWGGVVFWSRSSSPFHLIIQEICGPSEVVLKRPR